MDSIGQTLRSARENRGQTVEQVHDATRITPVNLSALEEDRFDFFPNRVYARAFLRDYANYLGLDSAELLDRYEREWNTRPEPEPVPKARRSFARAFGYFVLALVLVGGLCAAAYYGWQYVERRNAGVAPEAAARRPSAQLPRPARIAAPKPVSSPVPTPAPPKPTTPPAPEGLVLEVTASRDVWVGITADGARAFWNTLPAGQTRSFDAKNSVKITAGMAGAVVLKLNGKPQPSLGSLRRVGARVFTRKDIAD